MNNGMERFGALMAGKLPDRVPQIFNLCEHGARILGMPIKEYYASPEHVAEGQLRLRERFGYDTLLGFYHVAKEAEMLGCRRLIYAADGPPNVGHLVLDSYERIGTFAIPDNLDDNPHCRDVSRCIQLIKAGAGGRYPVLASMTASFSLPPILIGMDRWLNLLFNGPAALCRELLEKCSLFCRRYLAALRSAGADLITYVNPVASATFLSDRQFSELALPWVQRDFADGRTGDIVYFNGGGRIGPQIARLADTFPFAAYYLSPQDDIHRAKADVAGRALIVGTINDVRLLEWDAATIDREVARIMAEGAAGGGFAFGTLLTPYLVPDEKIVLLLKAASRYGSYAGDSVEG
ncbi:uroporphyrinogen decarboxylase family protein [Geobacter argillaceus]|uniref:Uroporphyrinogen decarboxylase n=1 Tax=Geobacter argillaceus TaxID=345631 RepID=A0A562VM59_9BACT|nr:uroporphyrinogen decarboxylase family protein [Geobacter argillaceus]TWJ18980.1 uroporphyrinogen decarboxylase [Geobacter argillaceus]